MLTIIQGSVIKALEVLIEHGVQESRIIFVNLISCPEGLRNLINRYPSLKIVTACVDEKLDENAYIIPGLGDFGCRYFGTN